MTSGMVHSESMSSTITANDGPTLPTTPVANNTTTATATATTTTTAFETGPNFPDARAPAPVARATRRSSSSNSNGSSSNGNGNSNGSGLPKPRSIGAAGFESRDTSFSSRNTRDSLRRNVSTRSSAFTESERQFLEQLTVDGTDREVESALRTVEDEDLFFFVEGDGFGGAAGTARGDNGGNDDDDDDIGLTMSLEDDATRDGVASSVANTEGKAGPDTGTATPRSSLTSLSRRDSLSLNASMNMSMSMNASIPSVVLGSQRRREVLERRRSESSYNLASLWRAHQSGLAVTQSGSRRSLLRRESSISSIGSFATNASGLSVVFGLKAHPGAARDDVFRSDRDRDQSRDRNDSSQKSAASFGSFVGTPQPPTQTKIKPKQPFRSLPLGVRRPPPFRRSRSITLAMIPTQRSLPRIPEPDALRPGASKHRRCQSTSASMVSASNSEARRKSVTFRHIDEELEFDTETATAALDALDAVDTVAKRPAAMAYRRSVSDSQIDHHHPGDEQEQEQDDSKNRLATLPPATAAANAAAAAAAKNPPPQRDTSLGSLPGLLRRATPLRQDSLSSIPSLHHGTPLRDSSSTIVTDRRGGGSSSVASFASLHHANPVRQESVSTIPSLHHANPIRQESVSTIPSLHHARPIRQDSVATIPSLHHANPIRQDSMATIPSLHHANPIRQDSMATIPSLHHANPIRQDSVASLASNHPPSATMNREDSAEQFIISEEVALAWVQSGKSQESGEEANRASDADAALSIPHDVTMPTVASSVDGEEEWPGEVSSLSKSNETSSSSLPRPKPVLMRQATRNMYEGEGVEVEEIQPKPMLDDEETEFPDGPITDGSLNENDSYYHQYQYRPQLDVFRTMSLFTNNNGMIRTAGSFDDISLFSSFGKQQRTTDVFRDNRIRSLSDDNMSTISNMFDQNREFLLQIPTSSDGQSEAFEDEISEDCGSTSWEMEFGSPKGRFDAWNILQDEYVNGYGGAGTLGFRILGTDGDDEDSKPHVLSPPLMESLQAFLPIAKSGQNFYMKYSMIRDGASLQTLLQRARGVTYSILAVETIDGEVFGSFTGQAWRKSWNYFGTGESFLWKMRHSRLEKTNGILEQAQKESEIDVYPYTGENGFIQLCTHDRIAVGGGIPDEASSSSSGEKKFDDSALVENHHDWGLGLALDADLLGGSSNPCITFGSPSLCKARPVGSRFEVINVELWTTTPCMTEEDAERLELGKLFLGGGGNDSDSNLGNNYNF